MFEFGLLWLIFCFVVSFGAINRGRSGFAWFLLSIIFSPFVAGVFLIILGEPSD